MFVRKFALKLFKSNNFGTAAFFTNLSTFGHGLTIKTQGDATSGEKTYYILKTKTVELYMHCQLNTVLRLMLGVL